MRPFLEGRINELLNKYLMRYEKKGLVILTRAETTDRFLLNSSRVGAGGNVLFKYHMALQDFVCTLEDLKQVIFVYISRKTSLLIMMLKVLLKC